MLETKNNEWNSLTTFCCITERDGLENAGFNPSTICRTYGAGGAGRTDGRWGNVELICGNSKGL